MFVAKKINYSYRTQLLLVFKQSLIPLRPFTKIAVTHYFPAPPELPLLRRFVWAGRAGGSGEHCSSSAAACGLCKLSGRLRSPRLTGSDEGIPKGRRSGVAFFWVTFSWPNKKR